MRHLLFLVAATALFLLPVHAQVGTQAPIAPNSIPQFVDPLPHFAGLRVNAKTATDVYVKAVPSKQVAVSTGTILATGTVGPLTPLVGQANVWVYQVSNNNSTWTPPLWPAYTIETERGNSLNVHYSNELGGETYAKVGLVVDQTLHWADPLMQMPLMTPYGGEPPITVHLHGGEVPPLSDGGPDSWFMPGSTPITGHSYNPDPYLYPNTQEAATLWFHDHALGVTRLNVYAGMAGFYFLRGGATEDALNLPGWSGDDLVQEAAGGFAPAAYLPEIEIAIQDRMFDTNGQLFFPNLPTNPLVHPTWTPEFVGDIISVNGKTWPYLSVAPRKYRFRILNGSNARTYELWLQDLASGVFGPVINQVGTDGGFLDAPVVIDPALGGKLILMPGERADVVIDFSAMPGAVWTMRNSGKTPYPAGTPPRGSTLGRIMQFVVNGTMVSAAIPSNVGADLSAIPTTLKTNVKLTNFLGAANPLIPAIAKTRQLTLNEVIGAGGPLEVLVNNTKYGGTNRPDFNLVSNGDGTDTYYSETMDEGTTEIWKIINLTADAHPIHLHLVQSQLMSRQKFNTNKYNKAYNAAFPGKVFIGGYGPPLDYNMNQTPGLIPTIGGNPDITPYLQGPLKPANPNERGWKDTFVMYPGEVTTVIARWAPTDKLATDAAANLWFDFDPNGGHGYVWHCHIIDHEDNEMMRPYNVNPNLFALRTFGKGAASQPVATNIPGEFRLEQNYPNPFNPTTEIRFALSEDSHVQLKIFNSLGQEVQTLIDQLAPAGNHTVKLDAKNLASGMYFYRIQAGSFTAMKKMMLLK